MRVGIALWLALAIGTGNVTQALAKQGYQIKPGDLLQVSVWREPDLQLEVLVRPDGGFSMPLAGDISAVGQSVEDLRLVIESRLQRYIPEPAVSVSVREIRGNVVYVIGKVNRPGQFLLSTKLDVMQALSVAGGTTTFADLNDIKILRREGNKQVAIPFHYRDVEKGRALKQNIILRSGDVVVVP